jgi:hypothetical protein
MAKMCGVDFGMPWYVGLQRFVVVGNHRHSPWRTLFQRFGFSLFISPAKHEIDLGNEAVEIRLCVKNVMDLLVGYGEAWPLVPTASS